LARDRESEPRARGVPRTGLPHPPKGLEEMLRIFRADADARVADTQHKESVVRVETEAHFSCIRELHGVCREVEHDLPELPWVRGKDNGLLWKLKGQGELLEVRHWRKQRCRVTQQR